MGGNRKNRGGNHHNNHNHRSSDNSNSSSNINGSLDDVQHLDLNKVLQEVDGGYQITWREIVMALTGIASLAILSTLVGVAAGMTISVHYYETQSPVAVRRMDPRDTSTMYSGSAAHRKVTTLDPTIASSNIMQSRDRDGLDLGKVITTSASGQLNVLLVVEEATPLHVDTRNTKSKTTSNDNDGSATPNTHSDEKHILMTTEQANLLVPGYTKWKESQPVIVLREATVIPTTCSDGDTIGFDDWYKLKAAVQEANSISAERFMKWSAYFANVGKSFAAFEDDDLYYEKYVVFTICPGLKLRARRGPIYINAENIVIECDDCTVDVGGTHLNFGPHAKNVLVRGVTFKGAHTSSMTFFHHGAEATFEDCYWIGNSGISAGYGAVADINSTSSVNFFRCEISQGIELSALGTGNPGTASSLSIRA